MFSQPQPSSSSQNTKLDKTIAPDVASLAAQMLFEVELTVGSAGQMFIEGSMEPMSEMRDHISEDRMVELNDLKATLAMLGLVGATFPDALRIKERLVPFFQEVATFFSTAQQHDDVELEAKLLRLGTTFKTFEDEVKQLISQVRDVSSNEEFTLHITPLKIPTPTLG